MSGAASAIGGPGGPRTAATLEPEDVSAFVVSNEAWGPQHFIKHRFAIELAGRGAEVFFCDPPAPWAVANLWHGRPQIEVIAPGLNVVRYRHPAPARLGSRRAAAINDRVMARRLRDLPAAGRVPVLWQFDAFRFAENHLGPDSLKIYHVCDPYAHLALDERSAESADLIVCTSELYTRHYAARHPGKTIHVPHSTTATGVRSGDGPGAEIRARFGDYLFLGGSITDRLDVSLLASVSEAFPATTLLVAGPVVGGAATRDAFAALAARDNVVHVGTVPAAEIPAYVGGSVACLSAYQFTDRTLLGPRTSILKVMDYLAEGKPVISSSPLEYSELEGRAIYCCSSPEEFTGAVGRVLAGELSVDVAAVDDFLRDRTYAKALDRILGALGEIRSGRAVRP